MKQNLIIKIVLFLFASASAVLLNAQDYLAGKLTDSLRHEHKIFYDRSQFAMGLSVYQTVYKVLDANKAQLYTISLTHDAFKSIVYLTYKGKNNAPQGTTVAYDKKTSGLVFSDCGKADTLFNSPENYAYLFSFTDGDRDYPVLHELQVAGCEQIQLDPLTRIRLRKNAEMVRAIIPPAAPAAQVISPSPLLRDTFLANMLALRDSLYAGSASYYEAITEMRGKIAEDVQHYFDEQKVAEGESRYAGQMKNGKPQGRGMQVDDGSIYDGIFEKGILDKGTAALRLNNSEYYGEYSAGEMSGVGWLKNKNGNFWLGMFAHGILSNGIALIKEVDGEVYFGNYKNGQKNGYGELRNPQGNCYYGDFRDGRLVTGYAKEVDQFGYATYARIEKGAKRTIEPEEAGEFFEATLYAKK
jgi:hypothetical protein